MVNVLVTDAGENHALAVIRSLGRRGITVAAADSTRLAKGLWSRHCAERALYPPPTEGAREFVDTVLEIIDRVRPDVFMPMTERAILPLLAHRARVESRVNAVTMPSDNAARVAFDKRATLALAASLGIAAPLTIWPDAADTVEALAATLTYPVAIKPRASEAWTTDGRIVPTGRVVYCRTADELRAAYPAVHRRAPLPVIQEFIPGDGYGICMLYCRGKARAAFAHRRIRMVHPTGSGSSLRISVEPPPEMLEAAYRLLDTLKWHGVAMVEFKLDRRDGRPRLMEINGRFWNSLPLAVAAGVDFPYLLYRLATVGDVPDCFDYRIGVQCRWLVGDARHLAAVFRGRPAGWPDEFPRRWTTLREFVRWRGPDRHYDVESLSDPLPAVFDVVNLLGPKLTAAIRLAAAPRVEESTHG